MIPETTTEPLRSNARPVWQRWFLVGSSLLAFLGVVCCGLSVFGGFQLFRSLQVEREAILPALQAFLEAGERQDASAAMALFTSDTATQVSVDDLARLFEERPELFADFTDVAAETINVTRGTVGIVARLEGFVTYASTTPQRRYTATLRKEADTWKLVSIQFPDGIGQ